MAGRIPEHLLDDILSRVDIVELISGYIPLKRVGRSFKALCPFHQEKTPSFIVSSDRQIYHCFGCNSGGNAFNFLMQYERLEFMEAVQVLAKKAGLDLPKSHKDDPQALSLATQLYKINELAALFYESGLNSNAASQPKDYLLKRGIKEAALKLFKIGYAPDRWDALINHSRSKAVSLSLLEKAGLILSKEGGGYYDRFRGRVIFPISDIKSRPIGFGARVLDDTLPKYINSPETPVYVKGRNLYGLNLSRDAIRESDSVVIVEGYLDFIMPYQEGLKNIVASLGTALTPEQAALLKRYTHNVIVVYDADKAGELAALRSLDIFLEEEMFVRVVSLPQGFDPDLFVRKHGIEKFKEKIEEAADLFDYKLRVLKNRHNISESQGKAKIASQMLPTVKLVKNAIIKAEYIRRLAEELGVAEHYVLEELGKVRGGQVYHPQPQSAVKQALNISPTEKLLIKLMLEETEFIESVRQQIEPADFQDERICRIVSIMFGLMEQGKAIEPHKLINYIEGADDILRLICESSFLPDMSGQDREQVMNDCVRRLKSERLKSKRQRLHEEIKTAQHSGDEKNLQRLMYEFHNLVKKGQK